MYKIPVDPKIRPLSAPYIAYARRVDEPYCYYITGRKGFDVEAQVLKFLADNGCTVEPARRERNGELASQVIKQGVYRYFIRNNTGK